MFVFVFVMILGSLLSILQHDHRYIVYVCPYELVEYPRAAIPVEST